MFFKDKGSGVRTTHNSLNPSFKISNKTQINICNTFYGTQFTFLCIIFICWISRTRCTGTKDVNAHMVPCVARLFYIYIYFCSTGMGFKAFYQGVFLLFYQRPSSLSFHRSSALLSLLEAVRLPANLALLFIPRRCHHTCIWKKDVTQHLLSSLF